MRTYGENLLQNTAEQNFNWAAKQSYIALGTALIAAAAEQVDATPMEGFNSQALDELLGLKDLGSTTILPLGYRDVETDWLVQLPKVRTAKENVNKTPDSIDLAFCFFRDLTEWLISPGKKHSLR